jgi:predicted metalloprotease
MKWEGREGSENVEDRRGMGAPMMVGGGIGTVVLVLLVMFLGGDRRVIEDILKDAQQQQGQQGQQEPGGEVQQTPEEAKSAEFVSVILKDTEDVWTKLFANAGKRYVKPKLVLFRQGTESGCGVADAGMGPFYCPVDEKVYIDLSFFEMMKKRQVGTPGDFAQAYVIAHEVGHHVQKQLGLTQEVERARREQSEEEANQMSVRLELQADYLAGVWAHHGQQMKGFLEKGDIEEALECAQAIGDDYLQKRSRGYANQESFTHGTSEQRYKYFRAGIETGDLKKIDFFFKTPYNQL